MIKSEFHIQIVVDGVAAQILQNDRSAEDMLRSVMTRQIGVSHPSSESRTIHADNLSVDFTPTSPFNKSPMLTLKSITPYDSLDEAQKIEAKLNESIHAFLVKFHKQLDLYLQGVRTK